MLKQRIDQTARSSIAGIVRDRTRRGRRGPRPEPAPAGDLAVDVGEQSGRRFRPRAARGAAARRAPGAPSVAAGHDAARRLAPAAPVAVPAEDRDDVGPAIGRRRDDEDLRLRHGSSRSHRRRAARRDRDRRRADRPSTSAVTASPTERAIRTRSSTGPRGGGRHVDPAPELSWTRTRGRPDSMITRRAASTAPTRPASIAMISAVSTARR